MPVIEITMWKMLMSYNMFLIWSKKFKLQKKMSVCVCIPYWKRSESCATG